MHGFFDARIVLGQLCRRSAFGFGVGSLRTLSTPLSASDGSRAAASTSGDCDGSRPTQRLRLSGRPQQCSDLRPNMSARRDTARNTR